MGKRKKVAVMLLTVGVAVAIDQASKYLALELLEGRGVLSYLNDSIRFLLAENRGGFLSLGASLGDGPRTVLFVVLTALFLFGFTLFTWFDRTAGPAVLVASSLIIGGGTGNLIDRVLRDGAVIDFVNVGVGRLRTGIFNVADMAVLFGCMLLFVFLLRSGGKHAGGKRR